MNRETKRMMQRQGQVEGDGSPAAAPRRTAAQTRRQASAAQSSEGMGTRVAEFAREVRTELRQVQWPKRPEIVRYSTVVFVTLVLLISLIALLNFAFSAGVNFLFPPIAS